MRGTSIRRRRFSWVAFVLALLVSYASLGILTFAGNNESHRTTSAPPLSSETDRMVANVDQAVQQVYDLRSFVVGSDGSGVGLTKLSEQLLRGDAVRSVFLAPNGIVTDVYPSKDIDAILGTNLYDQSLPSNTRASRRVVPASSP